MEMWKRESFPYGNSRWLVFSLVLFFVHESLNVFIDNGLEVFK